MQYVLFMSCYTYCRSLLWGTRLCWQRTHSRCRTNIDTDTDTGTTELHISRTKAPMASILASAFALPVAYTERPTLFTALRSSLHRVAFA